MTSGAIDFFGSYLDDFRIYDKALTQEEINTLYNVNQTPYTLTFDNPTECDILIVGGGGGGGKFGGGGGGGAILFRNNIELNGNLTIKTGKGGIGADAMVANGNGTNGYDSSILIDGVEYIAKGGGGGGTRPNVSPYSGRNGNDGGSGGGGSQSDSGQTYGGASVKNTYTGWDSYGNSGGNGRLGASAWTSGGGGGAGSVGSAATASKAGDGGTGKDFITYFGTNVGHNGWFGGGGGGNIYNNTATTNIGYGNGGNTLYGGGGNGGYDGSPDIPAIDGLPNTGGGGGGGKHSGGTAEDENGGNGGSGIVIIRYKYQYILHPTFDAQWTYSALDTSVHHYGNVGIGTIASDTTKLTIRGDTNITGNYYNNNRIICDNPWYEKDNKDIYTIGNNVGIGVLDPQYKLRVGGTLYANNGGFSGNGSTSWSTYSDRRIKENVVEASNEVCFENVNNINLYKFNYAAKYSKTTKRTQFGFVAQEVQKYYPKAVQEKELHVNDNLTINNLLTVDVTQLNYTLYGAIKHYVNEIDKIKSQLGIVDVVEEEPVTETTEEAVTEDAEEPVTNIDIV